MRTQPYELQGKDVPEALRGQVISLPISDTVEEAASILCENGMEDVNAKFNDGNVIRLQGRLRGRSAKALKDAAGDVTVAVGALQAFAAADKYSQRTEGSGVPREPKTAKGRQAKAAVNSGNRLFEKCLADENFLARMEKQGVVDRTEFDAWVTARAEVSATATA